jgi:hypothetical protein
MGCTILTRCYAPPLQLRKELEQTSAAIEHLKIELGNQLTNQLETSIKAMAEGEQARSAALSRSVEQRIDDITLETAEIGREVALVGQGSAASLQVMLIHTPARPLHRLASWLLRVIFRCMSLCMFDTEFSADIRGILESYYSRIYYSRIYYSRWYGFESIAGTRFAELSSAGRSSIYASVWCCAPRSVRCCRRTMQAVNVGHQCRR